MLVAMSITLLMMAAVVTVFANVSNSVNRRRATIEMAGELRGARELLSRDLENATCPTLPPRRPEANEGYLEIIEGPQTDFYPSIWLYDSPEDDRGEPDGVGNDTDAADRPRIDLSISSLPGSNLKGASIDPNGDEEGRGVAIGSSGATSAADELPESSPTDGRGLGDADDVLMLTVRNDNQPFVGRVPDFASPANGVSFPNWGRAELESPLAEVIWFAVENPPERDDQQTFAFGEPGYRTVYRRTLLIAPWLNYRIPVPGGSNERTGPGVVRVLPVGLRKEPGDAGYDEEDVVSAIAALVAFQERYDLSVRLEWDPMLGSTTSQAGRWVLRANSLADLTKRENRYEHHGLLVTSSGTTRGFPFAAVSAGVGYGAGQDVTFRVDPEYTAGATAEFEAVVDATNRVVAYEADRTRPASEILDASRQYPIRPVAYLDVENGTPATARAILNEDGSVVRVLRGFAPLSRHLVSGGIDDRRGDDIVLTDALAFDLRVYDPGAPLYGYYRGADTDRRADLILQPGDPAWATAFERDVPSWRASEHVANQLVGDLLPTTAAPFRFEGRGAYVDLGYGATSVVPTGADAGRVGAQFTAETGNPVSRISRGFDPSMRFFERVGLPRIASLHAAALSRVGPAFATYDTWSWHYENNGINEDGDDTQGFPLTLGISNGIPAVDEGTDGFDSPGRYDEDVDGNSVFDLATEPRNGIDDPGERETRPPYETALRGLQVTLRAYERDSLQIREVKVRESFVPE